uniref:Rho-GAP domain-containing protein n=1 Tax=Molossus molossus TaxID=27622 RepID=A0A7J8I006_MOLMO|nr:hypothetical protein HJG59_010855 [Molossus molossus]
MDEETKEEKIVLSRRLLEQLPRANAGLLRHLFGLLLTIQQHCSSNQMTARSLGSCPAPGIFCLPSACSNNSEGPVSGRYFNLRPLQCQDLWTNPVQYGKMVAINLFCQMKYLNLKKFNKLELVEMGKAKKDAHEQVLNTSRAKR